jgi:hypothetical protein
VLLALKEGHISWAVLTLAGLLNHLSPLLSGDILFHANSSRHCDYLILFEVKSWKCCLEIDFVINELFDCEWRAEAKVVSSSSYIRLEQIIRLLAQVINPSIENVTPAY